MVHLTSIARTLFKFSPATKAKYFNMQGYNKLGLYTDDLYNPMDDVAQEAVRRLKPEEYDAHVYRVIRAGQLEVQKAFIDQPISYEEDQTKGKFLQPYIDEVLKEKKEKEEWLSFLAKD